MRRKSETKTFGDKLEAEGDLDYPGDGEESVLGHVVTEEDDDKPSGQN